MESHEADRPASHREGDGYHLRAVVVEDQPDVREMLAELLVHEGLLVATFDNGREAVDGIIREHPDVALIDIGLPELNGYEVARRVRARPECGSIRLVALTGYGEPSDRERSRSAGFNAHLVKPATCDQILETLGVSPA